MTKMKATIKAYTTIEQSKKLAEILQLESADMEYLAIKENGELVGSVPFVKDNSEVEDSAYSHTYDRIACWSLAALLGVLPEIQGGKPIIALYDNYITYLHLSDLATKAENLVDACYEMILKLHELKLM